MTGPTIRPATRTDAAAVGHVHHRSWQETYADILPDHLLTDHSADSRTAMWQTVIDRPDEHGCVTVLVAEDRDRVIGFGACGRQRDDALAAAGFDGEIGAIYVLRSYQGHGAGRHLMAAMARALAVSNHSAATLWVLRQNHPARAFYEALGGTIVAEKVDPRSSADLAEMAYGWRDLSALIR